jgi:hypothetical protein
MEVVLEVYEDDLFDPSDISFLYVCTEVLTGVRTTDSLLNSTVSSTFPTSPTCLHSVWLVSPLPIYLPSPKTPDVAAGLRHGIYLLSPQKNLPSFSTVEREFRLHSSLFLSEVVLCEDFDR